MGWASEYLQSKTATSAWVAPLIGAGIGGITGALSGYIAPDDKVEKSRWHGAFHRGLTSTLVGGALGSVIDRTLLRPTMQEMAEKKKWRQDDRAKILELRYAENTTRPRIIIPSSNQLSPDELKNILGEG